MCWNVNDRNHILVYKYGKQLLEVRDIYNNSQNKVIYYPDVLSIRPYFISHNLLAVVTERKGVFMYDALRSLRPQTKFKESQLRIMPYKRITCPNYYITDKSHRFHMASVKE